MARKTVSLPIAAVLTGAALTGAGATVATLARHHTTTTVVRTVTVHGTPASATTHSLSAGQIYKRAYRGVVEILVTSTQASPSPFGAQQQSQTAQGSGFVLNATGEIVTNEHVIAGAQTIEVKFWNGRMYSAKVVTSDASLDLAVLKVNAPSSELHPLTLGDPGSVQVGDQVVAIGSPFGLQETVTSGIVSAVHRRISAANDATIGNAIQTDTAINHGNSGGPLLNDQGHVIGVNAQIESESGGSDGVGFAIAASAVRSLLSSL